MSGNHKLSYYYSLVSKCYDVVDHPMQVSTFDDAFASAFVIGCVITVIGFIVGLVLIWKCCHRLTEENSENSIGFIDTNGNVDQDELSKTIETQVAAALAGRQQTDKCISLFNSISNFLGTFATVGVRYTVYYCVN